MLIELLNYINSFRLKYIYIFSVHTVSQLVKSAGPLLRPHLPRLIPALLEAAGELEPMALNSLSVRLAGDQRSQDIVDTLRASAAKSHYTTETVSKVSTVIIMVLMKYNNVFKQIKYNFKNIHFKTYT